MSNKNFNPSSWLLMTQVWKMVKPFLSYELGFAPYRNAESASAIFVWRCESNFENSLWILIILFLSGLIIKLSLVELISDIVDSLSLLFSIVFIPETKHKKNLTFYIIAWFFFNFILYLRDFLLFVFVKGKYVVKACIITVEYFLCRDIWYFNCLIRVFLKA